MKRLTLIRHAKSDWNDPTATDFQRTLNARGRKAAPLMGQRMHQRGIRPELLISSPAQRARQTAELLAAQLALPAAGIRYDEALYGASLHQLIEVIDGLPELHHIAVVGHNPGLTDLGLWLCAAAPNWLPTCAVLELELMIGDWPEIMANCGRARYYDYPKKPSADDPARI